MASFFKKGEKGGDSNENDFKGQIFTPSIFACKAYSIYIPSNPGALSSSKDGKLAFKEEEGKKKNHSYPLFRASLLSFNSVPNSLRNIAS